MPDAHHGEKLQSIPQVFHRLRRHDICRSNSVQAIKRVLHDAATGEGMNTDQIGQRRGASSLEVYDPFLLTISFDDKCAEKPSGGVLFNAILAIAFKKRGLEADFLAQRALSS